MGRSETAINDTVEGEQPAFCSAIHKGARLACEPQGLSEVSGIGNVASVPFVEVAIDGYAYRVSLLFVSEGVQRGRSNIEVRGDDSVSVGLFSLSSADATGGGNGCTGRGGGNDGGHEATDSVRVFVQETWFMFDSEVVFLEAEYPTHEAGRWPALHSISHRVEPSEHLMVNDKFELLAPQVRSPILDRLDCGEKLDFGDGVVTFVLVEATAIVGNDMLFAIVICLTQHAS